MFTFAGVSAVFSRDVAVIDRKDRTVSSWRSILWFRRPTSYNLGDFSEIAIERRIRRGALGSSYPVFAVVLTGQSETIEVVALRTRAKSERVAREIGEFLEGTLIVANQR
jgi:hypothetical protein